MGKTGYPAARVHFVEGKVEDTIPRPGLTDVSLLRLDTDWYESTLHGLTHLFPLLAVGGVLILDDYGDWMGAQKATDEYFRRHPESPVLLTRVASRRTAGDQMPADGNHRLTSQPTNRPRKCNPEPHSMHRIRRDGTGLCSVSWPAFRPRAHSSRRIHQHGRPARPTLGNIRHAGRGRAFPWPSRLAEPPSTPGRGTPKSGRRGHDDWPVADWNAGLIRPRIGTGKSWPSITTTRGRHPWTWKSLMPLAMSRFRDIVFPSNFIRLEAETLCPPSGGSLTRPKPPSDPGTPGRATRRRTARVDLGLPPDVPVIGNAGWLIPRKRLRCIPSGAARVRPIVPDSIFVIAGDGLERATVGWHCPRNWALRRRSIGSAGASDLASFYRALDVLLFNADWDAFPTTPLEAMGYAIPVVASALNSGLGEAITDERYGMLLGAHDEPALADATVSLLRDPAAARRLGLAGRARVAELCDPETTVTAYERLLTGRPRST